MTTQTTSIRAAGAPPAIRRRATRALLRSELRLFLREPVGLFWALAFPVILLVILGLATLHSKPDADLDGLRIVDVYTPIVIAMSFAMLGVNALPPNLAGYRERGILKRLRTTPVGAPRLLGAQLAIYAAAAAVSTIAVLVVGRLAFGVHLPGSAPGFLTALLLAAASLLAIGLFIAAVAPSAKAANAIGAMTFFPLLFFAGLWVPREVMPQVLQSISDATPLGAGVQAMRDATAGDFPGLQQLGVMVVWAVIPGVFAGRLFRWE